jgi:hypothetical protein
MEKRLGGQMNIKKLAEQAGFVMWADESWKPEGAIIDWSSNYDKELERFAELIVRECIDESFEPLEIIDSERKI